MTKELLIIYWYFAWCNYDVMYLYINELILYFIQSCNFGIDYKIKVVVQDTTHTND